MLVSWTPARADLDQAQSLDPSDGNAFALRSIVFVALNDKEGALDNGRTAVERAPRSSRRTTSAVLRVAIEL